MRKTLLFCTCTLLTIYMMHSEDAVGTFWQITDIHLQLNYSRTGNIFNYCRGNFHIGKKFGEYGDVFCDSPFTLLHDAVTHMKKIQPNPDFILWTGDNIAHMFDDVDWSMILTAIEHVTSVITAAFPNTVIVPIIGNHDTDPSYDFNWTIFENFSNKYLTIGGWSKLIPTDQHDNFRKGGYYTVSVLPNLTILALNTILYVKSNRGDDPKDQFKWLKQQLQKAERNNKKVVMTSHIPPGYYPIFTPHIASPYADEYLQIIIDYAHVITSQIYGHLHVDSFTVGYDDYGVLKSSAFAALALTPWQIPLESERYHNPGVRMYKYQRISGEVLDYDQYTFDLASANRNANESETQDSWKLLYSAAIFYGVPNLSVTSMGLVYQKILCNDTFFDDYLKIHHGGVNVNCGIFCKRLQKCAVASLTEKVWYDCLLTGPNMFIKC